MMSVNTLRSSLWRYVILTLVLFACLWVGWRDFDPWVPQDEVRENIRSSIRWVIQILVQYVIPGAIIFFFGKEAITKLWSKKRVSSNET